MTSRGSRVKGSWSSNKQQTPKRQGGRNQGGQWSQRSNTYGLNKPMTYDRNNEVIRREPTKEQIVRDPGDIVLSDRDGEKSIISFQPEFISKDDADWMFETLLSELPWKVEHGKTRDGTPYAEPRMTAWFSDQPYTYARSTTHKANPNWHPLLTALCDRLNDMYPSHQYNSVMCNLYRDCKDSVDWHTDNEPALGTQPQIASVSFGCTRKFQLREIPDRPRSSFSEDEDPFLYTGKAVVNLTHGSLLMMLGALQKHWQHRVPKEYHDRDSRINLTFRRMYPVAR